MNRHGISLLVVLLACTSAAWAQTPSVVPTTPVAPNTPLVPIAPGDSNALPAPGPSAPIAPSINPPSPNPTANSELEGIRKRIEQQDEEIRLLRERLGTMQSEPRPLPPVQAQPMPALQPLSMPQAPSGVIQASACEPSNTDLEGRIKALECTAEKQAMLDNLSESPAPKGYEVGSDTKMSGAFKNGLQFQSANKDFRTHVGGIVQFDIAMFDNDEALVVPQATGGIGPQPDSLNFRRVRVRLDGTMYETFEYLLQFDLNNFVTSPNANVQNPASPNPAYNEIYITWTQLPIVGNFRVGNFKEPIGFEHIESDTFLPFMERSYLQDFVFGPFNGGYTPGLDFFNWTKDQNATWAIGLFGNNDDNFGYSLGNDYALTGRATWLPYYDEPSDGRYLLHFGVAGSTRGADENLVRLRVRGDIRSGPPGILNPIYADTGNLGATIQNIAAFEMAAVMGSFSVVGEYVGTSIENATQLVNNVPVSRGTPWFQGGYIQCGYFLTGEHEVYNRQRGTFDRVTPYENAFCTRSCAGECKGWGAWQVVARYNSLNLNDNGINGGSLDSFTFGVNWFWNANARMQLNYDFTSRGPVKQVAAGDINSLGIRFGYDF
jgi:phosphate-selective porin OprO/OprP